MTTIRTASLCHGTVDLSERDVHLVYPDNQDAAYYSFACPECGLINRRLADVTVSERLLTTDVIVVDVARDVDEAYDDAALERLLGAS